jgi:hypothetical protein
MELHSALLKSPEHANNLLPWEELEFWHALAPLAVAPHRWVGILELKRIERAAVAAKARSHTLIDEILQDVEIKVDKGRVFVGFLQTSWVVGHREAVNCI